MSSVMQMNWHISLHIFFGSSKIFLSPTLTFLLTRVTYRADLHVCGLQKVIFSKDTFTFGCDDQVARISFLRI